MGRFCKQNALSRKSSTGKCIFSLTFSDKYKKTVFTADTYSGRLYSTQKKSRKYRTFNMEIVGFEPTSLYSHKLLKSKNPYKCIVSLL
nr:MAG TPA: hypothetical protein [Caudoviricetes sp.]